MNFSDSPYVKANSSGEICFETGTSDDINPHIYRFVYRTTLDINEISLITLLRSNFRVWLARKLPGLNDQKRGSISQYNPFSIDSTAGAFTLEKTVNSTLTTY